MSEQESAPPKTFHWSKVFIEIALRAIRRVHFEYAAWNLGSPGKIEIAKLSGLNQGQGFELAREQAVCAAIMTELISIRATHGILVQTDGAERQWEIDVERNYDGNSALLVDFWIKRAGGEGENYDPVYVEAKRAVRHRTAVEGGHVPSLNDIDKDIEKLQKERKHFSEKGSKIFPHLLVWGTTRDADSDGSNIKEAESPESFFKSKPVKIHEVRWFPIDLGTDFNHSAPPEKITHWGWVALAELN